MKRKIRAINDLSWYFIISELRHTVIGNVFSSTGL